MTPKELEKKISENGIGVVNFQPIDIPIGKDCPEGTICGRLLMVAWDFSWITIEPFSRADIGGAKRISTEEIYNIRLMSKDEVMERINFLAYFCNWKEERKIRIQTILEKSIATNA